MTLDFTYYRPAAPEAELSAYFMERLGLRRSFEQDTFPIYGDRWWGNHHFETLDDNEDVAERLGIESGELSILVFEQRKALSTEEFYRAELDLFGAVADQLNETPGLTGMLAFDIYVLIERPPGGSTFLDSSLADPEDWNHDDHLAPLFPRGTIADLTDFD